MLPVKGKNTLSFSVVAIEPFPRKILIAVFPTSVQQVQPMRHCQVLLSLDIVTYI